MKHIIKQIEIGSEVFHRYRQDFNTFKYTQKGIITGVEEGCNGGIIVKWFTHGFEWGMVDTDLVVECEESGNMLVLNLDHKSGLIFGVTP